MKRFSFRRWACAALSLCILLSAAGDRAAGRRRWRSTLAGHGNPCGNRRRG